MLPAIPSQHIPPDGPVTMSHSEHHGSSSKGPIIAILATLGIYVASLAAGIPQRLTQQLVEGAHHETHHDDEHGDSHSEEGHAENGHPEEGHTEEHAEVGEASQDAHSDHSIAAPPVWTVIPFVLLLGSIAVLPLIPKTEHWWESNLHRFWVAAGLGVVTLLYYGLMHESPIDGHFPTHFVTQPSDGAFDIGMANTILGNAILQEFIPFIVLLFSLYTISGGIRIEGDLQATPLTNAAFMLAGGLLASFIGTTGAAMLLIRPLLETNVERQRVVHTVVFFIFVVCNCGGCLLPIGDPPLFLGYLHGVPFFWTLKLWPAFLLCNGLLLVTYVAYDKFWHYPHESIRDIQRDKTQVRNLRFSGLAVNVPLLLGVVAAVAFLDPSKTVPGTEQLFGEAWHPWMYFREIVQLTLVGLSLALGSAAVRTKNSFNYHAILEVAALFIGIFICMQPALQILNINGAKLGVDTTTEFFWITGGLSSVLDNAPTYLVFFETAKTLPEGATTVAGITEELLVAISLGAVFMGAMTYIGNGPNFMVKAIAEKSGVRMPSFFGYMGYSVTFLLPILAVVAWFCL